VDVADMNKLAFRFFLLRRVDPIEDVHMVNRGVSHMTMWMVITALLLISLSWALLVACPRAEASGDVAAEFDYWCSRWQASLLEIIGFSSRMDERACFDDNPAYQRIVGLGIEAVPLIMARMKVDPNVGRALLDITKWRYHIMRTGTPGQYAWTVEEFPDVRTTTGPPNGILLCERWWSELRSRTPERFAKAYAEWQALKGEGKEKEAEEKRQRIQDLGIDILPLVVEKVKHGDANLIPVVSYLTDGKLPESAKPEECVSWWTANKDKWTLPPPETAREPDK